MPLLLQIFVQLLYQAQLLILYSESVGGFLGRLLELLITIRVKIILLFLFAPRDVLPLILLLVRSATFGTDCTR